MRSMEITICRNILPQVEQVAVANDRKIAVPISFYTETSCWVEAGTIPVSFQMHNMAHLTRQTPDSSDYSVIFQV